MEKSGQCVFLSPVYHIGHTYLFITRAQNVRALLAFPPSAQLKQICIN